VNHASSFAVLSDNTPPTVTDNADTAWHKTDVTVRLNSLDDGSGVGRIQYRLSTPADPAWHDCKVDDTHGQFTVLAPDNHSNDGAHVYRYRALDNLGNSSATGVCTVKIDTNGPTVSDNAPAGWKKTAVTVTINATDAGSGAAKVQYRRVGSGDWSDATMIDGTHHGQFVVAAPASHANDGINNYEYRAIDNLDNVGASGTCSVRIDTTGPTVSDDAPTGWNSSDVTVTITALDAGCGVAKIQYRRSTSLDPVWHDAIGGQFVVQALSNHTNDGANVYRYRAIDNLGNVSGTGICTVRINTM
jgi:hypothetical protein